MSGYEGAGTSMSDTSPSDYGGWGMAFEVSNPAAQRGIPGQDVPEVQGPSQFAPGTNISVGPAGTMQDTIDAFFGKPEAFHRSNISNRCRISSSLSLTRQAFITRSSSKERDLLIQLEAWEDGLPACLRNESKKDRKISY